MTQTPETPPGRRKLSSAEVLDLARAWHAQSRWQEAADAYRHVLRDRPHDAAIHNDCGTTLAALGQHDAAIRHFTMACEHDAGHAAAYSNLGISLVATHRYREAIASFRVAITVDPSMAEAHANLGSALLDLDHPDDALPHLDQALALDPTLAEAFNTRGHAFVTLGDLDAAQSDFAAAVALRPDRGDFYDGLAATRLLASDDPDFLAMQSLARDAEDKPGGGRIGLQFALHRAYEHQGRHAQSFQHLARGNAMRRSIIAYDEATTLASMQRIAEVFGPDMMSRAPVRPSAPGLPIFILGMPRSGSTLVEQILASHRDVHGTGELGLLNDAAGRLDAMPYPQSALSCPSAAFAALGDAYLAQLRELAPGAVRATDKMPLNFRHVGLIRMALPAARVIHTRRDPADTCLSCFAQTFTKGLPFTNDLAELGRYYRAYAALMAHWRAVLPEPFMLDVTYEDLVADFEPQVRRILNFCGLDWDPACLAFHQHKRPVLTVSATQVRRPLYQNSVARARRYGSDLQPLLTALGDVSP